jgi:hypothetical protein
MDEIKMLKARIEEALTRHWGDPAAQIDAIADILAIDLDSCEPLHERDEGDGPTGTP